ncbi:hypothetical protein Y032_0062g3398 [Ancylostoma ceylanicum]|uniref:Uncharacterized protein n=1 Tax=Ancylostoma ceylanicum TaxID=53326 RepID=A0A016U1K5_9BILA|nr:hypothetical protein Y032_0062g3398 [Ancylostoma ceylanicum]
MTLYRLFALPVVLFSLLSQSSLWARQISVSHANRKSPPISQDVRHSISCNKTLDGIPFTTDAQNNVHCVPRFHEKYALVVPSATKASFNKRARKSRYELSPWTSRSIPTATNVRTADFCYPARSGARSSWLLPARLTSLLQDV